MYNFQDLMDYLADRPLIAIDIRERAELMLDSLPENKPSLHSVLASSIEFDPYDEDLVEELKKLAISRDEPLWSV